ncbi:MAG: aminopeptidase P N-terminal domain-containing protein [Thermoanaerobaculales bacterium]
MIDERAFCGGQYAAELEKPEAYRRRRKRVQVRLKDGEVALLLGATDARGYGDVGTFRQDRSFFYLTGVELPNAALILEKRREMLLLPARKPALEAWTGPKFGPGDETARVLGFEAVLDIGYSEVVLEARRRPMPGLLDRIAGYLEAGGVLWIALPGGTSGALSEEQRLVATLRERLASFTVRDLSPLLAELRLVKDRGEIALMHKAVDASIVAMRAGAEAVHPGAREGEVEGAAFAALRGVGAEGWSFPPIVGSGLAGCVLHYDANLGILAAGELVVVDIGARYGYYCGDLTRTFPVSGRFSRRQRKLYDAVLAAYAAAVRTLKPGSTLAAARKAAFAALEKSGVPGEGGKALGQFFIHGLGHFLGLEAHDAGGEGPALVPGMIVTVEPGVYLPREGIGIRIEDDYLITRSGAENLSATLPRDADAIEEILGRK